ncbi:uncharacterized protein IL334_005347 [Kwoniella shivajii]|uniref:Uncharacterized protein n=1 Tax=Kwoniella shivajii TaxID=564305 RepID=A0ABZ1D3F5_9TREE|nr:hypothetical protein IL334_005347 [Kwoniella shivajii]
MRFISVNLCFIVLLFLAESGLSSSVVNDSRISSHRPARREDAKAPLHGEYGIGEVDGYKWKWPSTWLVSVLVAVVHADPDMAKKFVKDDTNAEISEADFRLYNYQGEEKIINQKWKDISHDADYVHDSDPPNWEVAGIESAALQMGGYMGLNQKRISRGNPVDAFKMIINKKARIEDLKTDEDTWKWIKKSQDTPVIFGTNGEDISKSKAGWREKWTWYAGLNCSMSEKRKDDEPEWKNAK